MGKRVIITEQQVYKPIIEAKATKHFKQRLKQRLNTIDLPSKDIIRINQEIKKVNRNNFDKDKSFAVRLIRFNPDPNSKSYFVYNNKPYYRVYDERGKDSTGDELWVIIRGNQMHTFMLRKASQTANIQQAKDRLDVDEIIY